jgi:Ca2+:H+ antiporter
VVRRLLLAGLALAPLVVLVRFATDAGDVVLFLLAAAALVPLAWLIGESTEHAAVHTGPGVGGFLNASFGNAPELIIALLAINEGLPDVVRGTITGSVVSNILLVLGVAMVCGGRGELDTRSLVLQLLVVAGAVALMLVPSATGWATDASEHDLALLSIPIAVVLLAIYLVVTIRNLRRHSAAHETDESAVEWSLRRALLVLGVATLATAFVSEVLVHSLEGFGHAAGLSDFFIAVVIVALVGNAAEHGGAVVIASRGDMKLASEIAISSSAQVAVFVAPMIALLSWLVGDGLSLAFRPVEVATMGVAALGVAWVVRDGVSRRWEGFALIGVYVGMVAVYYIAGDSS